ncbi:LysR family transcriptional regulator [Vagococcus lutrae]|uniref:LysR family transcriptional regulator n=1 Tax=Vagococcus lutrae TaxID=81947 RepID=A0AAF0BCZ0_9ENTE|nr:LysR family transcriptional regulator [Vagococcus lutrae]WCG23193.1 LysR family transcriptional regulator [Vagococcus lutrae]
MIGKLDLYRIFQVVSQNKSFSKASQELFTTQSAVSQSISKLEMELGVTLFYRTPKGVTLTQEGEMLESYTRQALTTIRAAEDRLLDFQEMKTGELRLAVGDTIARYVLLPYLETYHSQYPQIKLKILNGTTAEIIAYIKAGEADVGLCHLPIEESQMEIYPFKEIHDVFITSSSSDLALDKKWSFQSVADLPLILLEKQSNSRTYVDQFMTSRGVTLKPVIELGSYDLITEFAKINLGISCVVQEFVEEYLEKGIVKKLPLLEEVPPRHIGVIHLKNMPLPQAAHVFIDRLKE